MIKDYKTIRIKFNHIIKQTTVQNEGMILSVIPIVLENNWLPWQHFNVIKNGKCEKNK